MLNREELETLERINNKWWFLFAWDRAKKPLYWVLSLLWGLLVGGLMLWGAYWLLTHAHDKL